MLAEHFYPLYSINDSVPVKKATVDTIKKSLVPRSDTIVTKLSVKKDSVVTKTIKPRQTKDSVHIVRPTAISSQKIEHKIVKVHNDSAKQQKTVKVPYQRFAFYSQQDSAFSYKSAVFTELNKTNTTLQKGLHQIPHHYKRIHLNWTLFIALISVLLLMGLKTYYQKFVTQVISTVVNFQLAEKMLREKNILVRRAFFMLNINFFIVFSLFLVLLLKAANIQISGNYVKDYFYVSIVLFMVLIVRLFIINILGYIFEVRSTTTEYIHNIYLINKNIGLILLPVVFTSIYTNESISKVILLIGLVIVLLGSLFKIIKGLQIILKNGVLLFYSFLYLCTLELLPVVLGSKVLLALS